MSFETVRCAIHVSACKQTRDVHIEARKTFKFMCVLESNMNIRSDVRTNLHSTVLNQLNLFTIRISTKFGIYLFIYVWRQSLLFAQAIFVLFNVNIDCIYRNFGLYSSCKTSTLSEKQQTINESNEIIFSCSME